MKRLFYILLIINLLGLIAVGVFVHKIGGVTYTIDKIQAALVKNESVSKTKISIYESLSQPKGGIVFLGDSITANNEWSESFNRTNMYNRGIGDDTTSGVLSRINQIVMMKPEKVFIMIGINDINAGLSPEVILGNYDKILSEFTKKLPGTEIYIQSILPINSNLNSSRVKNNVVKEINLKLDELANKYSQSYVDLYSAVEAADELSPSLTFDGVHLNGEGYQIWKDKIESYVN